MTTELDSIHTIGDIDSNDKTDLDTEEIAKKHAYNEFKREQQQAEEDFLDSRQLRTQRKEYAEKIFVLISVWLIAVVLIIWNSGTRYLWLSDSVLIALITTSTATVIGLMAIVCNYTPAR